MLKTILTISGKPGLYKLLSRGRGMVIVESLDNEKKRFPVQGTDKVVTLGDISIYTDSDELPLSQVLESIKTKENEQLLTLDIKNADNETLKEYFAAILPQYDRERVYPTHIKKILSWYNILVKNGITEFVQAKEDEAEKPKEQQN